MEGSRQWPTLAGNKQTCGINSEVEGRLYNRESKKRGKREKGNNFNKKVKSARSKQIKTD